MKSDEKMSQIIHDLEVNKAFQERLKYAREAVGAGKGMEPLFEVLYEFGVDWEMFNYIRENGPTNLRTLVGEIDMCVAGYTAEEDIYGFGPYSEEAKKLHRLAYPVTIDIHRFAVRQDVINFVREKWDEIERWRTFVNGEKSISPKKRRRRPKKEISYFVYENKDKMSREDLKKRVREKFNLKGFTSDDLNTIISDEKKRRNRSIKA